MTREELIKKQAEIYTDDASNYTEWSNGWEAHNDIKFVEKAFIEGAKWADNNICLSSIWNDTSIMLSDNKGIIYLTNKSIIMKIIQNMIFSRLLKKVLNGLTITLNHIG